jgi:hypothetical protein
LPQFGQRAVNVAPLAFEQVDLLDTFSAPDPWRNHDPAPTASRGFQ